VELIGYEPRPGGAVVTIAWPGARADLGGEFLSQAVGNGVIRDFSLSTAMNARIVNGRRIYTASYQVSF
jgi:hypothetical protein